jgi:PKD repeat protein
VTLRVTDDKGATTSVTHDVMVTGTTPPPPPPPTNQSPTASFTFRTDGLSASFDGTDSQDPDGRIASYAWDFGDGGSDTGATSSHLYTTPGTYHVTLTVTDDQGATNAITHDVTVTGLSTNQSPTASFTFRTDLLTASFDGTGSRDPDGRIASYAWDFGDNKSGTGATPSHPYRTPGTYHVTLTVTDDQGATASAAKTITVRKVRTRTVLTVHRRLIQKGAKAVLVATVRPAAYVAVTGTLQVRDHGRVIRSWRLRGDALGERTVRIRVGGLSVGRHRLRITYTGSATTAASSSAVVVVRVVRRH